MFYKSLLVAALLCCETRVEALELGRSRMIVEAGQERETAVMRLGNPTSTPVLVQAWMDADHAGPVLYVTPPLLRIEPGATAYIRIRELDTHKRPAACESLHRLNLQALPWREGEDEDGLAIHVIHRIKVFFRPPNLAGDADFAARDLEWMKTSRGAVSELRVRNRHAFAVVIPAGALRTDDGTPLNPQTLHLAPDSTEVLVLGAPAAGDIVRYDYLDDRGERVEVRARLRQGGINESP